MKFEEFRSRFHRALAESRLRVMGHPEENLDVRDLDRTYRVYVEPPGGQDAEPFFVTATFEWRWTALQTARTNTTEEDALTELLGREHQGDVETERPWIRVDIELNAALPYGEPSPMPLAPKRREWVREVRGRLEKIEILVSEDIEDDATGSRLAWRGEPELRAVCDPDGELLLERVACRAWQGVRLPRAWDDPGREDEAPDDELAAMFARVRAALLAWQEALSSLRGTGGRAG